MEALFRWMPRTTVPQLLLLFVLCYLTTVLYLSNSHVPSDVMLDSSAAAPATDKDAPVCRGFYDGRRGRVIWGWVCAANDGRPCQIQVVMDGSVILTALADNRRPDLAGVCTDLNHGFAIELPVFAGSHDVTLKAAVVGSNRFSVFAGPLSFGAEPRPPSRLWIESLTNHSVTLHWEGSLSAEPPITRYEIELDGSLTLISMPATSRSTAIGGLTSEAQHSIVIRAVNEKSVGLWSSPLTFRTFSDGDHAMQFLLFLPTEGFTNQLVAILHAAVFAKALNFTLVIPSLYSRTAMVRSSQVKDVEDPGTFRRLPFATFYDTQIFIQRMSALGVSVVDHLPKDVRLRHISTRLPRHVPFSEALSALSVYQHMSHVCLDIGPTFFRFVPTSCDDHHFLWQVYDALYLNTRIRQAAGTIRDYLQKQHPSGRWNALHHRNEKDAQETWKSLIRSKNIGAFLSERGFDMDLPLYVACGDPCDVTGLDDLPKGFIRKIDVIPNIQNDFENAQDLLSAVELLVCIDAANFAGPSFSAFSHLIMSVRGRAKMPFVATVLPPGEEMTNLLGETTPAVDCSAALVQRQMKARRSMRLNEGVRLTAEAIERTNNSQQHLSAIVSLAFEDNMAQQASRLADDLGVRFLFKSERKVISAVAQLQAGSMISALREFSEALKWKAEVTDFGLRLRRYLATEPKLWMDLDAHAPGYRRVLLQHFPALDGKKMLLISHNMEIQGAPLCLFQLIQYLVETGVRVFVVSPFDGPLRETLEELDVSVLISPQYAIKQNFESFDLVLLNTLETWWAMEVIPRHFHHKVVWWVHESTREQYWKQYPALPALFTQARKHIFVTDLSRRNFRDIVLRSSEIIHNGVPQHAVETVIRTNLRDEVRRTLGLSDSHFLVSLIGSVNRHKNQIDFVKVAGQLLVQYQGPLKPHFLIGGFTGEIADYEKEVLKLIQALHLHDHVHLLNKSPDVMKYFAASDAYACPSVVESFGRTIIEAMAFGVPVVAYSSDGIPEVLQGGNCGYLVPAGDWKLMASILLDLMTNQAEAIRIGLQGRHCVLESYTEAKMLHKLATSLSEVIHTSKLNASRTDECRAPKPLPSAACVDQQWLVFGGLDIQQDLVIHGTVSFKGTISQRQGTTLHLAVSSELKATITATGDISLKGLLQLSLSDEPVWFAQYILLQSDTRVLFDGKLRLHMERDPGCEYRAAAYIACDGRCLALSFTPLSCSRRWKAVILAMSAFVFILTLFRCKRALDWSRRRTSATRIGVLEL